MNKLRKIRLTDLATLLFNLKKGAADPDVGFEDTSRTVKEVMTRLTRNVYLPTKLIESALWSSLMLSEKNEFYDIEGRTFDEFTKAFLEHGEKFDKDYCFIKGDE